MFNQVEDDSNPVEDWSWRFKTSFKVVSDIIGWPNYKWMPDGHISSLKVTSSEK